MKKEIKTHITLLVCLVLLVALLTSCKTKIQYVPIETVKTEYVAKHYRDSVFVKDMVRIYQKGDTVYKDSIVREYRNIIRVDTICKTDSIQIPYEIQLPPVEKRVYPKWLVIFAIVGGCSFGFTIYRIVKLF